MHAHHSYEMKREREAENPQDGRQVDLVNDQQPAIQSRMLSTVANELIQAAEEIQTPSSIARISQFMNIDGHLLQWAPSKDMQALTSICKTGNSIAGLLLAHTIHLNKEKEERQLCVLLEKWKTCRPHCDRTARNGQGLSFANLSRMCRLSIDPCHSLNYGNCVFSATLQGGCSDKAPNTRRLGNRQRIGGVAESTGGTAIRASPKDGETTAETVEIKNVISRTLLALYSRDKRLSGQRSQESNKLASPSVRGHSDGECDAAKQTQTAQRWRDDSNECGWVDLWQLVIDPRGVEGFNRTCLHIFALTILMYENKVCIKEYGKHSSGIPSYAVRIVDEDEVKGSGSSFSALETSGSDVALASHSQCDDPGTRMPFERTRQAILSPWNYGVYQNLCRAMQLTPDAEPMVDTKAMLAQIGGSPRRLQEERTQSNLPPEIGGSSLCLNRPDDQNISSDKCATKRARWRELHSADADTGRSSSDVPDSDVETGNLMKKSRTGS
ncbi:hypothetical protein TGGT1_298050 [Toxoplasma gondii GT1]|uniref:Nse4 n=3 Tax=Toxoplasma gondii TaxID=5811 RepID=S7UKR3_TOXGG|nr:hypothetical protein TGGT1_298050 [Toxoplasma gondii GT1]KAF4645794.1 hypothetical protein TGRH88_002800 [Toxoplasma gondii]KFG40101.1 Nse4 [Toxoplasma gondii FOU]